ncbi:hypothetical protein QE152_g25467 [Popillia japonica]|uniref:Uncharacterized protein n=1 Tax=Popillia japonica TaxID=7064 RepID=A0AAW1K002_POPJA
MKLGNQWYTMEARERLSLQRRSENGKEGQVLKSAMHYTMEARERLSLQRRSENGKEGQVLKSAMHACLAFGRVKELE